MLKFVFLFLIVSCGQVNNSDKIIKLSINGSFTEFKTPFLENAVESSLVNYQGEVVTFADFGMKGNFSLASTTITEIGQNHRFSYVMEHEGFYYNFILRSNSIFLEKSADLKNWTLINNKLPVLSSSIGSIYANIWNVAVTVDDNHVWHLLVESSPTGNKNAGLAYSHATMNSDDEINFDLQKTPDFVISESGNPWIQFVPNRGIVAVYGKQQADYWTIKAATMSNNKWKESSYFSIGKKNIDVCDPHIIESPNGLIMNISYDQKSIFQLISNQTMDEFFLQISQ